MVTVLFTLLLAYTVSASPVRYDQRQEGDFNVHAHLENFVIVLLPSNGVSLLDFTAKAVSNRKDQLLLQHSAAEDSKNKLVANKFVSPSSADGTKLSSPDFPARKSPYTVDIDKNCNNSQENQKEVLIAHPAPISSRPGDAEPPSAVTTQSPEVETMQVPQEAPSEGKNVVPNKHDDNDKKLKDKIASTIQVPQSTSLSEEKDTVNSQITADIPINPASAEEKDKVVSGPNHRGSSKHETDVTALKDGTKQEDLEKPASQGKPKAIDFDAVQERSKDDLTKSYEEQIPVLEFSQFLKAINGAADGEDKTESQERLLSSGLEECGPGWRRDRQGRCEQITPKQRIESTRKRWADALENVSDIKAKLLRGSNSLGWTLPTLGCSS